MKVKRNCVVVNERVNNGKAVWSTQRLWFFVSHSVFVLVIIGCGCGCGCGCCCISDIFNKQNNAIMGVILPPKRKRRFNVPQNGHLFVNPISINISDCF